MSLSLSIHTLSDHLDMYGEPDPMSAYSLSGHVAITVSSGFSFFERRRTARFLLQSLSLTFEAQSEMITPSTGYSAMRLCSITRDLVPLDEPTELSNEGQEDSREPCVWNIIFNIPVPGWLPASSFTSLEELGIRCGLYATAKLIDLDESRSGPWALAALCAPFRSRTKVIQARKRVELRRFIASPSPDPPIFATINYLVNKLTITAKTKEKIIPPDVLSKIQIILSVPEIISMDENKVPIVLRMGANGLSKDDCQRIQLIDISLDLHQIEKRRNRPSTSYRNRFPLPPPEQQPPNEPLMDPSPIATIYDVGIFPITSRCDAVSKRFSLLPPQEDGRYTLSGNNYIFINNGSATSTGSDEERQSIWYTFEMPTPFAAEAMPLKDIDWHTTVPLQPSLSSPFLVVYHEAVVSLTCSYDFPDSNEVAQAKLSFIVPVTFGQLPPPSPQTSLLPHTPRRSSSSSRNPSAPALPDVGPYAATLPAYSQLYDASGQRKADYSIPLPLYTPPSSQESRAGGTCRASLEVVNLTLEGNQPRKWENILQSEDDDAEETAPLLGTSTR